MTQYFVLILMILLLCSSCTFAQKVLLISHSGCGYTDRLTEELTKTGIDVTEADHDSPLESLIPGSRLVIIADAAAFPSEAYPVLDRYMKEGGRLLTLGGPVFSELTYGYEGKRLTKENYLRTFINNLPDSQKETILNVSDSSFSQKITRGTSHPDGTVIYTSGDYGLAGSSGQLKCEVPDLRTWEMFSYPVNSALKSPKVLSFSAKGTGNTPSLYLEVLDSSGSCWSGSITLTEEWQQYALRPEDFVWKHDSAQSDSEYPDFGKLRTVLFGFNRMLVRIMEGSHTYYLSDVQLLDTDIPGTGVPEIILKSVCPEDEVYPVRNAVSLRTGTNQIFVRDRGYVLPDRLFSCCPGRQGTGFNKKRNMRFIPLIEAYDSKNIRCGYAAWMNIMVSERDTNGEYEGCITGCFSPQSEDFYNEDGIAAVCETAKAMLSPALLIEGGTEEYIYVKAKTRSITAGGAFTAFGADSDGYTVTTSLYKNDRLLAEYSSESPAAGAHNIFSSGSSFGTEKNLPTRAVTVLRRGDEILDRIEQKDLIFWSPKPKREYITVRDGVFMQGDKPLNFFGINYMPSSCFPERDHYVYANYVNLASYDPDVIDTDLQRIKDIGFNAVSVFITADYMDSNNMLDLIDRCDKLGIYVDLSVRAEGDLHFGDRKQIKSVISRLMTDKLDNLIAYDTAWEKQFGGYPSRKQWDKDWEKWIEEQYGSIEHAEDLWQAEVPRDENGNITGVPDDMLCTGTDKNTKLVSAYRRFADDLAARLFTDTYNYYRKCDPNHLCSFRMNFSGSGYSKTSIGPERYAYDFCGLAPAVAFMEPEGYALRHEYSDSLLQVIFANAYARYAKPDAPVVWKEFGRSMWNGSNFTPSADLLEEQKQYYEAALEHMCRGYSGGMFCWFYSGGYRINENSDYGIINPDGSDRPVTALLREYAPRFINQPRAKEPDTVITIDRDMDSRGIHGIFDRVLSELRESYAAGRTIAFEDAHTCFAHTLTGFADGNTMADGLYPMKYVNSMVKTADTVRKQNGKTVKVTLINTGRAPWQAATVTVRLGSTEAAVRKDVPYLGEITVELPYSEGRIRTYINGIPFGTGYDIR